MTHGYPDSDCTRSTLRRRAGAVGERRGAGRHAEGGACLCGRAGLLPFASVKGCSAAVSGGSRCVYGDSMASALLLTLAAVLAIWHGRRPASRCLDANSMPVRSDTCATSVDTPATHIGRNCALSFKLEWHNVGRPGHANMHLSLRAVGPDGCVCSSTEPDVFVCRRSLSWCGNSSLRAASPARHSLPRTSPPGSLLLRHAPSFQAVFPRHFPQMFALTHVSGDQRRQREMEGGGRSWWMEEGM
eukprot:3791422-Rhodomonas_salina.4